MCLSVMNVVVLLAVPPIHTAAQVVVFLIIVLDCIPVLTTCHRPSLYCHQLD